MLEGREEIGFLSPLRCGNVPSFPMSQYLLFILLQGRDGEHTSGDRQGQHTPNSLTTAWLQPHVLCPRASQLPWASCRDREWEKVWKHGQEDFLLLQAEPRVMSGVLKAWVESAGVRAEAPQMPEPGSPAVSPLPAVFTERGPSGGDLGRCAVLWRLLHWSKKSPLTNACGSRLGELPAEGVGGNPKGQTRTRREGGRPERSSPEAAGSVPGLLGPGELKPQGLPPGKGAQNGPGHTGRGRACTQNLAHECPQQRDSHRGGGRGNPPPDCPWARGFVPGERKGSTGTSGRWARTSGNTLKTTGLSPLNG